MERLRKHFGPTRFANLSQNQACLILAVFMVTVVCGIIFCDKSVSAQKALSNSTSSDAEVYRSILDRVNTGENYYEVAVNELRTKGYATKPFFNVRLPLLACLSAKLLNPEIARWLLILLSLAMFVMWLLVLSKMSGPYIMLLGGLLLQGTIVSCFTNTAFLFHEVWAGVLIAFSIAVYSHNRMLSVTAGLLALFIRELSLPFAVVMLLLAYKQDRRKEAICWLIGIAAFFLYLFIHAKTVSGFLNDTDQANAPWIRFGGWSFVLLTTKWTLPTFFTPLWIDAILLPVILIGVTGCRGDLGKRLALSIGIYVFAFAVAGRDDNYYWGLMYAPLLPLGLIYAPPALVDLCKAARRKVMPTTTA
jgi:hypothetical protein